jgi:hypothetical protein
MLCTLCQKPIEIGDWPFCPHGKGVNSIIPDDIPGGVDIRHGICNDDGTPKRYYSKSEIAKAAKAKGYVNHVEHVPMPGSDKSPHTTRWI